MILYNCIHQSLVWLFNSHWHDCSTVTGTIVQQLLTQLFNSNWHNCSTVTGTIIQQSLARLFNSRWHDYSTVTGAILQQWLVRFFNSHGQDFFIYLCWQNFSTVMFTVEESYHVRGIQHMIQGLYLEMLILSSMAESLFQLNFFSWGLLYIWYNCSLDWLKHFIDVTFIENYFSFLAWIKSVITWFIFSFYLFKH